MLIKFLITASIIFNPLISLVVGLSDPVEISPIQLQPKKLPLAIDLQFQKAAISAVNAVNAINFLPIRDWGIDSPDVEAKAALIFDSEKNKVLYQKNINQVLPIASLTKLMTALVVLENISVEEAVIISESAIAAYGDRGGLVLDEKITVKNLLYVLLMESSNDAAHALAEAVEKKTGKSFIDLMNEKAQNLDLEKTQFTDPSGYNPDNVSTVGEIAQLVRYSFGEPLIWEIMKTPMIELFSVDRKTRHYWINTDKLLARLENVVGGKTGYTEEAGGCLILVLKENRGYLISVILGTQERFLETERLIRWVKKAYQW